MRAQTPKQKIKREQTSTTGTTLVVVAMDVVAMDSDAPVRTLTAQWGYQTKSR
ncbi:hypothetical protein AB6D20_027905 (plasmid) [Vibrio splendidus]